MTAIKRLWGIRHIRAALFCYRCNRHYAFWHQLGWFAVCGWSDAEIEHWEAIKRGDA